MKTLNEVGIDTRFCSKLPMFARTELKEDLREIAKEWIKELEKDYNPQHHESIILESQAKIDWIKQFFNLEDN